MQVDLISVFPTMLDSVVSCSMLQRAIKKELIQYTSHDLRQWSENKHFTVDDRPFGGGAGMLLQPGPLVSAIKSVRCAEKKSYVIYLCPDGELLTSRIAKDLATLEQLVLVSGHYEGIDQRVRDHYIDREISIGDYILTNGTIAAGVLMDAVSRYIPGVLGNESSLEQDSFSENLLTFPQYTRPEIFENYKVPDVLLSGNHEEIRKWRETQRIERTKILRPDLYAQWKRSKE